MKPHRGSAVGVAVLRLLVVAVGAVVVLQLAGGLAYALSPPPDLSSLVARALIPSWLTTAVVAATAVATAVILAFRTSGGGEVQAAATAALFMPTLSTSLWALAASATGLQGRFWRGPVGRALEVSSILVLVGPSMSLLAFFRLTSIFPRRVTALLSHRGLDRLHRSLLRPWFLWLLVGAPVGALALSVAPVSILRTSGLTVFQVALDGAEMGALVCFGLSLRNLALSRRHGSPMDRDRVWWIYVGFVGASVAAGLGALSTALLWLPALPTEGWGAVGLRVMGVVAYQLIPLFLTLGLALAVLARGAVDRRAVLDRAVLSSVSGAVAVFVFAGAEELVTNWANAVLGLSSGIASLILAGTVALLWGYLHRVFGKWRAPHGDGSSEARLETSHSDGGDAVR